MLENDDIARRLDNRDGFSLVSFHEVGLPVYRFPLAITLQETSELGAIEEYVLRAVRLGIDCTQHLERFLGLPNSVLMSQLGRLVFESAIAPYGDDNGRYRLLPEGSRRLASSASSSVVRHRVPVYVDGITRKIVVVDSAQLMQASELEQIGHSLVYPASRQRPNPTELDLTAINKLIQSSNVQSLPSHGLRAVRIDGLVGRPNLYFQRALAVAFKSKDGRKVSIGFAIDGRLSDEHEIEYERSGAALRSSVFSPIFDADKRRREVNAANRELAQVVDVEPAHSKGRELTLKHSRASRKVESNHIRVLSVYDHPPLLRDAIEHAAKRIVIISPWLRAAVITPDFVKSLTGCLSRGVELVIAFGIGKKDPGEKPADAKAREALESLTKAFSNFRLIRKGNTHAKVLLVDSSYFVTTSFNWLSFRGDPNQPMREEEGTLVKDPVAVDSYYDLLMQRLAEER